MTNREPLLRIKKNYQLFYSQPDQWWLYYCFDSVRYSNMVDMTQC